MGIMLAIEDADNNRVGSEDLEAAVDTAVEVGADQAELNEQADGVAGDAAEVEAAVADTNELEAIGDVAQASIESGEGMSEQAAEVATIAIERIHQRLGFRGKQRIVPATESFGHTGTRLASTKLIVEGIVDVLKNVWNAIKSMAKRIWDKIVSIFAKLTGSGKMLRDQIENLKKRAEKISPASEMKEKELNNKGLAKKLSINKVADEGSYKKLAENASKLTEAAAALVKSAQAKAKLVRNILEAVTGPNVTKETIDKVLGRGDVVASTDSVVKRIQAFDDAKFEQKDGKDKTTVTAYGHFINNQSIFMTKDNEADATGAFRTIIAFGPLKEDNVADKAVALNSTQIISILKVAGDIASKIEDQKKIEKEGEDTAKNIIAGCEKLLNSVNKMAETTDSEVRRGFSDAKEKVQECFNILNTMGGQAPTIYYNTAALGAEYASACLANFK